MLFFATALALTAPVLALKGQGTHLEVTSEAKFSTAVEPRQWGFRFTDEPKKVKLHVSMGYCFGEKEPRVDRVGVVELRNAAIITVFVRHFSLKDPPEACGGVGLGLVRTVRLGRKARSIALYDGKPAPPKKRWPR